MLTARLTKKLLLLTAALAVGFLGGVGLVRWLGYGPNGESAALAEASEALSRSFIRILYVTAQEVPELQTLAEAENVVTTSDVRFAEQVDALSPLDVLMFDSSVMSGLNQAWVKERYSYGMAVVGVNVGIVELAEFVGDRTLASSWARASVPSGRFYSLLQLYVTGDNAEEVERWKQEAHRLLQEDGSFRAMDHVTSNLSISGIRIQAPIVDSESLAIVFRNIEQSTLDATP